jgi:hypothetical protein
LYYLRTETILVSDLFEIIYKRLDRRIGKMSERESFTPNFVWAFAFVLAVAIIFGGMYYSGFLDGNKKHQIDVDIKGPTVSQRS